MNESETFIQRKTDDLLPKLIGDEKRFRQVMVNLLKNAFKFTKKGQIEAKFFYDMANAELIVHVKDSGKGIK